MDIKNFVDDIALYYGVQDNGHGGYSVSMPLSKLSDRAETFLPNSYKYDENYCARFVKSNGSLIVTLVPVPTRSIFSADSIISFAAPTINILVGSKHHHYAIKVPGIGETNSLAELRAISHIEQLLEAELYNLVTDSDNYEHCNTTTVNSTDKFSNNNSDPIALVRNWKYQVSRTTGQVPNKAILSKDTYAALVSHPRIQGISFSLLASHFGLPGGIRVCQRLALNPGTGRLDNVFPKGTMLLFVDNALAELHTVGGGLQVDASTSTVIFSGRVALPSTTNTITGFLARGLA